jgi:hypothetical protein
MSPRSITVFVKRDGGMFKAFTNHADAIDSQSATIAARRCAARHFEVPEADIELDPEGDHVMIASVERKLPPKEKFSWTVCLVSAGVIFVAIKLFWMIVSYLFGGGR